MVTRLWHGWTNPADADSYQALLLTSILPEMGSIEGHRGGYVLRKDESDETEFVVLTFWESMDAVHKFAGPTATTPVITPAASEFLVRYDRHATHYKSFRSE